MNFGGYGGWCTYSTVHFLFIIKKNGKSTRGWPIVISNSTSFWFKKNFLGWIIKKLQKGGLVLFLYKVSIVVLIDFIAILLTPGIFLIQIVNTCNTNMYLIHFHSKNILKICFPKVGFSNFNLILLIHYTSQHDEINCVDISKDFTTMYCHLIFKKTNNLINNYIV